MRHLLALLALIGLVGIAFGVLAILHPTPGPAGQLPFSHESYGGPGSIIAGVVMVATSLYLRAASQGRD